MTGRSIVAVAHRAARIIPIPVAVLSMSILAGCDANFEVPAAATVCSESGVQCQMPDGPLGVCERAPCPGASTSPCFQCTPQH